MNIVRYHHWPRAGAQHVPFKNVFERFMDQGAANGPSDSTAHWSPQVDVREEASRFVIVADLPGVDPEQIEIQMEKNVLTIKGQRLQPSAAEDARYSRSERRHGEFQRRFALPETAEAEGISASGRHGVLEIVIPKKAELAPRRIKVGTVAESDSQVLESQAP